MKFYLTQRNQPTTAQLWDSFFNDDFFAPRRASKVMHTDIEENEDNYTLSIDLAGYNKEDIQLDYCDGYLTVKATKKEDDKRNYIQRERASENQRSYYVGDVDQQSLEASYTNGVLNVVVPKAAVEPKNTTVLIK